MFLTDNINLDSIPNKIKKKIHVSFTSFESTSYKKLDYTAKILFISCCYTLAFTSADMTFYNILELHSSLSKKRYFIINFPFLIDSPNPSTWANFFVDAPLFRTTKHSCQNNLSF